MKGSDLSEAVASAIELDGDIESKDFVRTQNYIASLLEEHKVSSS